MLGAIVFLSIGSGGSTQTDTLIALGFDAAWIAVGATWLATNSRATRRSLLVSPATAKAGEA
jgi:hypothetical protein